MKFTLSWIDYSVIISYILIIFYLGFFISKIKGTNTKENFLLAGRKLTLPFFIATIVATWYGNILGIGEFVYNSGLVAWLCFGIPYYIAALIFGIFVAKKIRESEHISIPEQISSKLGSMPGSISAVIVLIITIPASYILMLGILIQLFTGWNLWLSIIAGAVISLIYLFSGGFKADVLTNTAQFVLMYVGFGVLLYFTVINYGSPVFLPEKLPESHLSLTGVYSWQYIAVWFIIALQTFVDPSFYQRCSAAKSKETARKGIIISVIFWLLFDFLTIITGLYAKANFININPMLSYPILGETVLPAFWKGLFIVSMLAVIMSSLDSYAFISAATIGNDIIPRLTRFIDKGRQKLLKINSLSIKNVKSTDNVSVITATRLGLLISSVTAVFMAIIIPSAIQLIYKTASVAIPGLLIPLLLSYSKKYTVSKNNAVILLITPALISLLWMITQEIVKKNIGEGQLSIFEIEPMMVGMAISIIYGIFSIKKI